jgi:uncharacterized membrane protein
MESSAWASAVTVIVIAICFAAYYITKIKHTDKAREIEKLGELKAKGLLTEEEFAKQKQKIFRD